jgi:hypothetical protein
MTGGKPGYANLHHKERERTLRPQRKRVDRYPATRPPSFKPFENFADRMTPARHFTIRLCLKKHVSPATGKLCLHRGKRRSCQEQGTTMRRSAIARRCTRPNVRRRQRAATTDEGTDDELEGSEGSPCWQRLPKETPEASAGGAEAQAGGTLEGSKEPQLARAQ